jgi:glycosyltransferase involved in cell wall biosynthesis
MTVRTFGPRPLVSVVIPVYNNAATLEELCRRLGVALALHTHEIILCVDASPDASLDIARSLAARQPHLRCLALARNVGQHAACLAGLTRARGRWCAVMDADLQDRPEDIPRLLQLGQTGGELVFAGRRGRYESSPRLASSWLFRRTIYALGGVPRDAGMFFVAQGALVARILEHKSSHASLVVLASKLAEASRVLPVIRDHARERRSAYTIRRRLLVGFRAACCLLECRLGGFPWSKPTRAWAELIEYDSGPVPPGGSAERSGGGCMGDGDAFMAGERLSNNFDAGSGAQPAGPQGGDDRIDILPPDVGSTNGKNIRSRFTTKKYA